MGYKSILVHVDDGAACAQRVAVAARLALTFDAQLAGIYLVPGVEISPSIAAVLTTEIVDRRMRAESDAQHRAERTFRDATAAAKLTKVDWRAPAGAATEAATLHGRCSDLFVLGQAEPGSPGFNFAEDLMTTSLLSSGQPTLIVPYVGARPTLGDNVLVAWDGSREASRAVADAMPILERASSVGVIAVKRKNGGDRDGVQGAARLTAWLAVHGVQVEVARDDVPDISIADWLLSRAADSGTDLVVMGGYGHTRMREIILGGVTRAMLHSMTVPVLMSH